MEQDRATESASRAAQNQALFREVNERVESLNEAFTELLPLGDWICECADPTCAERIPMTLQEYEAVRSLSTHFAVAPREAHVVPEVERLVERHERFWVVEKFGAAGGVAAKLDPRLRRIGDGYRWTPIDGGARSAFTRTQPSFRTSTPSGRAATRLRRSASTSGPSLRAAGPRLPRPQQTRLRSSVS